jgi:hypothetical protein
MLYRGKFWEIQPILLFLACLQIGESWNLSSCQLKRINRYQAEQQKKITDKPLILILILIYLFFHKTKKARVFFPLNEFKQSKRN